MKDLKLYIGLGVTIAGVIFGYGQVVKAVENNKEDIQTVACTQQQLIDKFYTAQMEMNTRMYEHMLESNGEGDEKRMGH